MRHSQEEFWDKPSEWLTSGEQRLGPGRPRIERPELDESYKGRLVWDDTWKGVAGRPAGLERQPPPQRCHCHRPGGLGDEQP